jgi:hypothetical protein
VSITPTTSVYQPGGILAGLSRVRSGHVVSVKFSFTDEAKANSERVYEGGEESNYHRIVDSAKYEFAAALGIYDWRRSVMVHETKVDGVRFWFLSSVHPMDLPKPKYEYDTSAALKHTIGSGAIDI